MECGYNFNYYYHMDFFSLQVAAELQIMVVISVTSNSPPSILLPSHLLLPHNVVYASPNASTAINLTYHDSDTALAMTVSLLLPPFPPSWVVVRRPVLTGARVCEAAILLEPTEDQLGSHILCFEASDNRQEKSAPTCVVVVVIIALIEVSSCFYLELFHIIFFSYLFLQLTCVFSPNHCLYSNHR